MLRHFAHGSFKRLRTSSLQLGARSTISGVLLSRQIDRRKSSTQALLGDTTAPAGTQSHLCKTTTSNLCSKRCLHRLHRHPHTLPCFILPHSHRINQHQCNKTPTKIRYHRRWAPPAVQMHSTNTLGYYHVPTPAATICTLGGYHLHARVNMCPPHTKTTI